jgi:hypothetical protein
LHCDLLLTLNHSVLLTVSFATRATVSVMPSFYNSRQLPLTPPEFNTGYQNSNCAGMHYQQHSYVAPQTMGRQDESGYDYNGRYAQPQVSAPMPTSMMHQHQQQSYPHATVNMPPINRYVDSTVGLPLPPVRSFDQSMVPASEPHYRQQDYRSHYEPQQQPKAKEEKPVGGVSAKLDYDMDWMTDFVAEMALKMYDLCDSSISLLNIDIFKSVQPGKQVHEGFRSWVHGVLCATRLPSATIILSLHYLSTRMNMLSTSRQVVPQEGQIYRLLTVALILGSKFLDDNTFINRSWADVSLIEVKVLNQLELEWLMSINFKLHHDADEAHGFSMWLGHWKEWEAQSLARGARSLKLSPLDTNVQHHGAVHKSFTPQSTHSAFPPPSAQDYSARPAQTQYPTPSYAPYDPWVIPRSSQDTSPASAPHTGPTTPEYYGGPGTWAPLDNGTYTYSGRTFGFAPLSQPRAQQHSQPHQSAANFTPFTPQYHNNPWTNHSMHCRCGHCTQQHMPYFMAPGYGPQIAAA